MYILAISAAGEVSTKDDANIWHKGKDASCRWRYNQVHLFLPRACCHYSFLSHANVQISLLLVKAHSDIEDAVPILKRQRVWEHGANGMEALSHGRDPAPRDLISPSPHSGPLVAFFLASWETGGEYEWFWWRLGWRVRRGLAGGLQGHLGSPQTRVLLECIFKGCEMSRPRGAGVAPLAWAAALMQKGLLGFPGAQKIALPPISDN